MIDYKEFAKAELNRVISIQDRFKEEFDIDSYAHWFYDDESSILRLYNDEIDEIFFRYIPIGTYSLNKNTWMWSWFNNYLSEKIKLRLYKLSNSEKRTNMKN